MSPSAMCLCCVQIQIMPLQVEGNIQKPLINNYDYMKWEEVNKAAHNQKKISGVWYNKRKPIVHKELP